MAHPFFANLGDELTINFNKKSNKEQTEIWSVLSFFRLHQHRANLNDKQITHRSGLFPTSLVPATHA